MDPGRIRAYLQVACAGLGFEIGEIWWTSNEHGSSTVAAIGEFFWGGCYHCSFRSLSMYERPDIIESHGKHTF